MDILLFLFSNAALALGSHFAARALFPNRRGAEQTLAAIALFPVAAIACLLLLGICGLLVPIAQALAALICLGSGLVVSHFRDRQALTGEESQPPSPLLHPWLILAAAFLAARLCSLVLFPLPGLTGDDWGYHGSPLGHWIQAESLHVFNLQWQATFPLHPELFTLWFVLPLRWDAMAFLAPLTWLALLVAAGAVLVQQLAPGKTALAGAAALGTLLLATFVLDDILHTLSANDLAAPACVLASLAMLPLGVMPLQVRRERVATLILSGALAGAAAGAKASSIPLCAILLLIVCLAPEVGAHWKKRLVAALVFLGAALLHGGFWYARNLLLTGNPLFPIAVGPFDGPMTAESLERSRLVWWLLQSPTDIGQWAYVLANLADWPFGLCAVSLLGVALALWTLLRRRAKTVQPFPVGLVLALLTLWAASVLLFPLMPFSGTNTGPEAPLRIDKRFLVLPFAVGLILYAAVLGRAARGHRLLGALGLAAVALSFRCEAASDLQAAAMAIAGFLGAMGASVALSEPIRQRLATHQVAVAWAVAVVALLALGPIVKVRGSHLDQAVFQAGGAAVPFGRVLQELEALPPGTRVAWRTPAPYLSYPFFGRRFHIVPVATDARGNPQKPLIETWRAAPSPPPDQPTPLRETLRSHGVEYVIVSPWPREAWPEAEGILKELGVEGSAEEQRGGWVVSVSEE